VSGFDQILQNTEKISLLSFPSIGSSPARKSIEGVGAVRLRFRIEEKITKRPDFAYGCVLWIWIWVCIFIQNRSGFSLKILLLPLQHIGLL
jgi:hypothetical protein